MKYFLLLTFVFFFININKIVAQESPVQWTFSTEKIDNKTAYFVMEAEIQEGWRVFGRFPYIEEKVDSIPTIYIGKFPANSKCNNDIGPICLEIIYEENENITLGQVFSNEVSFEKYSFLFEGNIIYYESKIRLIQKIRKQENRKLEGYLTYMTCDDEKCRPPTDVDFSVAFPE